MGKGRPQFHGKTMGNQINHISELSCLRNEEAGGTCHPTSFHLLLRGFVTN